MEADPPKRVVMSAPERNTSLPDASYHDQHHIVVRRAPAFAWGTGWLQPIDTRIYRKQWMAMYVKEEHTLYEWAVWMPERKVQ